MGVRTAWQDAVASVLVAQVESRMDGGAVWSRIGGHAPISHWSLAIGPKRCFVKIGRAQDLDALSAEAAGLQALAATHALRVPAAHAVGETEGAAFLALEWLDLAQGGRDADLGRALARLHQTTAPRFGWHRDNTIGPTPQTNAWHDEWAAFFRDRRLAPQLALAARNGYGGALQREGERLLAVVPALLTGHRPRPSLLHGDLWSGNAGRLADGAPVVFDPACYFGDREADVAMTGLFGGFDMAFYAAYRETAGLDAGYPLRRTLYNLYHVLNHLNLFGATYLRRAEAMVAELLAAAR